MHFLGKLIFKPFQNTWQLLTVLSIPAVLLGWFGLNQLGVVDSSLVVPAEFIKFLCEFLFLGILLSVLQIIGLKNKWFLGLLMFFYYVAMTADLVLLWYFKERFGAKYLNTLEGGDYNFMTDWRVITYLIFLAVFSVSSVRYFLKDSSRKVALHRLLVCLVGTLILYVANPLWLLPSPANFSS